MRNNEPFTKLISRDKREIALGPKSLSDGIYQPKYSLVEKLTLN